VAPDKVGEFEITGEIARGGMGVVYRARDPKLDRDVALKVLRSDEPLGDELLVRFRREAQAAAQLKHRNLVSVYEAGEADGEPYLVMDLIEGEDLKSKLAREGPLPPQVAARYTQQLARALEHAHQQGVLHRDIKPSNVLVDAEGQPVLTDFGLAKILEKGITALTKTGQVMGTPAYMSPEQASGDVRLIGPSSDVYSLGATLYTMLTGKPPFSAQSVVRVLGMVLSKRPEPPSKLRPGLDPVLDLVCLKCMEKLSKNRYQTATALAEDLGLFLGSDEAQRKLATSASASRVSSDSLGGDSYVSVVFDSLVSYQLRRLRLGVFLLTVLFVLALALAGALAWRLQDARVQLAGYQGEGLPAASTAPVASAAFNQAYRSGRERHDLGDYAGAVAAFTRAIEIHEDPLAFFRRGKSHQALSDLAEAKADYERALARIPEGDSLAGTVRAALAEVAGAPSPGPSPAGVPPPASPAGGSG
jgi:tRNA A-37 threonylcarbamoyl transferase component Bud32